MPVRDYVKNFNRFDKAVNSIHILWMVSSYTVLKWKEDWFG